MLYSRIISLILSIILILTPISVLADENEPSDLNWINGPATVTLGDELATLQISDKFTFLNAEDTVTFNESIGNFETGYEIGMVLPVDVEQNWFVVFEYEEVGYIKDDESKEIDASSILAGYKKGTEEQNKELEELGFPPLHVIGWDEEPSYDPTTHNLVWSMKLESDGEELFNHNTRILGRYGYVSATLVADTLEIESAKEQLNEILAGFSFNEGKRYEDFDPAVDKLADYGLTALIAGGVGAAAVKSGLLAAIIVFLKKFGVVILAAIAGLWTWIRKRLKKTSDEEQSINS